MEIVQVEVGLRLIRLAHLSLRCYPLNIAIGISSWMESTLKNYFLRVLNIGLDFRIILNFYWSLALMTPVSSQNWA